ncbi:hypothetical protein IAD21_02694 [Abditibacteriota bacterium]|nr:hypothetical protein IAD21_02694 [Abditibacteriota bacterium]
MSPDYVKEILWLRSWFARESDRLIYVGIFGSVAKNTFNPNDLDLLIVVSASLGSEEWERVISMRSHLKHEWEQAFSLELHLCVVSEAEMREPLPFVEALFEDGKIEIVGCLDNFRIAQPE